jgi:hypothetical protein
MRYGLAKPLRRGHRLAEKRRYRRRGNNEQPNFQNVRLSFSSTASVLIWLVQLAGRHMAKTLRFSGSRFETRISNYWQLDWLSGKAPDFSKTNPLASTEDQAADPLWCPRQQREPVPGKIDCFFCALTPSPAYQGAGRARSKALTLSADFVFDTRS